MANATKFFYDPEFVGACVSRILENPFWEEQNGVIGELTDQSVDTWFSHTLPSCGFSNILMEKGLTAIQVRDNLVREVTIKQLVEFMQFVLSRLPEGNTVIDRLVQKYPKFLDKKVLTTLRILEDYAPLKDRRNRAYRFYKNGAVVITGSTNEVELVEYKDLDGFVYLNQIIDRDFNTSLLNYNEEDLMDDSQDKPGYEFLKWMKNLCRDQVDGEWILDTRRFRSMFSSYGYLLHQYWNDYKCVIFVDAEMESGKANGRTGKSVVLNDSLSAALNTCVVDAKTISKKKSSSSSKDFAFTFVDQSTQHICFDDACDDFDFNGLFSVITGDLTVNPKFGRMAKFGKKEKPKMSISSNHPILGEGPSYADRQHFVECGKFYQHHKMVLGKTPDKFHGGWLFDEDEWGTKNWEEFDATCVYALQFYLSHGLLGGGCSEKYSLSKLHSTVGSAELCSALYRLIQEYAGSGIRLYQKTLDGMSEEQKSRSVSAYLEANVPGEEFTPTQISSALGLVAKHYGFRVKGLKEEDRMQKRFGPGAGKGVNSYLIGDSQTSFPKEKVETNSVEPETVVDEPVEEPVVEEPKSLVAAYESHNEDMSQEEVEALFA